MHTKPLNLHKRVELFEGNVIKEIAKFLSEQ